MPILAPAKRRSAPRSSGSTTFREQVLLFRVGEEACALRIRGLWEVLLPEGVTMLPTPSYQFCTALAYRGHRLPLIRMSELFGVPMDRVPATARVLLIRGSGRALGLLVDEVMGVDEVDPVRVVPVPPLATQLNPKLFRGCFGRQGRAVLLVDEDGLGGLDEVTQFSGPMAEPSGTDGRQA
jgi:chemotaxis signal transduction protein